MFVKQKCSQKRSEEQIDLNFDCEERRRLREREMVTQM